MAKCMEKRNDETAFLLNGLKAMLRIIKNEISFENSKVVKRTLVKMS